MLSVAILAQGVCCLNHPQLEGVLVVALVMSGPALLALMDLVGELPLKDVVQLRAVCRALHADSEPYAIALAFGSTRTHIGEFSMTLSKWRGIWGECASAAKSQSIEASSWGHAIEWVQMEHLYDLDDKFNFSKFDFFYCDEYWDVYQVTAAEYQLNPKDAAPIIDDMIVCSQLQGFSFAECVPRVAVILSLTGHNMTHEFTNIEALVILSDGCFAAVSGVSDSFDAVDKRKKVTAVVFFSNTLAGLAPLLVQDFGGRLQITQHIPELGPNPHQIDESYPQPHQRNHSLRRYAGDGVPYTHIEFLLWHAMRHIEWHDSYSHDFITECIDYANDRWEMARPSSRRSFCCHGR